MPSGVPQSDAGVSASTDPVEAILSGLHTCDGAGVCLRPGLRSVGLQVRSGVRRPSRPLLPRLLGLMLVEGMQAVVGADVPQPHLHQQQGALRQSALLGRGRQAVPAGAERQRCGQCWVLLGRDLAAVAAEAAMRCRSHWQLLSGPRAHLSIAPS